MVVLKVRDMYEFRKRWAEDSGESCSEKLISHIGSIYDDECGRRFKGYFGVVHGGTKEDIKSFLKKEINLTGSYQVIYELMQNANDSNDDKGGGKLLVYYDDKYLLFANNGKPFSKKNIRAICNVGQSDKNKIENKTSSGVIGKFGIGFKLIYHLVGGIEQIMNYGAPIIFSWSSRDEINDFLNCEDFETDNIEHPVLFKPVLTAVPIHVDEEVYDLKGIKRVLFKKEEILELKNFIGEKGIKDKLMEFDRASLFFLKLSDKQVISFEENLEKQITEIENSLIFLKYLDEVVIERSSHKKPENIKIFPESGELSKDIVIAYGSYNDSLKNRPNIYNYFPVADERHDLNFIIHAPDFEIEASRRSLQWDKEENIIILNNAARLIECEMENRKIIISKYEELLYTILSSDEPKKDEIKEHIYGPLKKYALKNIPCKDSRGNVLFESENKVVIKNTELNVYPEELGIAKYWLCFENEKFYYIFNRKIGNKYSIIDLINNGDTDKINNWIKKLSDDEYLKFIGELNKKLRVENTKLKKEIKWIRFGKEHLSVSNIEENYSLYLSSLVHKNIKEVLENIGVKFSNVDFSEYDDILKIFFGKYVETYVNTIFTYVNKNTTEISKLTPMEKKDLFLWFEHENLVNSKLREIKLFKNKKENVIELQRLIEPNKYLKFLRDFEIDDTEYFEELNNYLCKENEVFKFIILKDENIKHIAKSVPMSEIREFYEKLMEYYDLDNQTTNEDIEKLKTKEFILIKIYDKTLLKSPNEVITIEPKFLKGINVGVLNKCFEKFFEKYVPVCDALCVIFNNRNERLYYQLQFKEFNKNNLITEDIELTESEMEEYLKFLANLGEKLNCKYNVIRWENEL